MAEKHPCRAQINKFKMAAMYRIVRGPTRDTASHNKTYAHFLQKLGCFTEICMLHGNTRAPWKYNWLRRNMSGSVEI